jgi:hypothetical protein
MDARVDTAKTLWLSWLGVLALASGCGPGTMSGVFEGAPFELRYTTLALNPGRLFIFAQDKVTACTEHMQSGRAFNLELRFPVEQGLPSLGTYALSTYDHTVTPSVIPVRVVTDETCGIVRVAHAEAGVVELVKLTQDPRTKALEAELNVNLTFSGDVVAGTLTGGTCTSAANWYCGPR